MSSSSGDEISEGSQKMSLDASSAHHQELLDSPSPTSNVNRGRQEYFPSRKKSSEPRSKTPPYTWWKNENIHLFRHDLQSSFGRKLQNSREIVYPTSTSSPPVALEKPIDKKCSNSDIGHIHEEPLSSPPPDLWRPSGMEPIGCVHRCSSCSNSLCPQQRKLMVSTQANPCLPQTDSYHSCNSPQSSCNHSQSSHFCCSSPRMPQHRSPVHHNDQSLPKRKKAQDKTDVPLDLYRIVLLQNQQLGELQRQVKNLTKVVDTLQKEASENRAPREIREVRKSSLGVQTYCEEKLSVGVMTSILQVPERQKKKPSYESSSSEEIPTSSPSSSGELPHRKDWTSSTKSKQIMSPPRLRSNDIPANAKGWPPSASVPVEVPEFDSSNSCTSSSYESTSTSSSESDDNSGKEENGGPPKIGWTYYDAVVGKVNEMLSENPYAGGQYDNNAIKRATLEHLISIGVSFAELDLQQCHKRVTFGTNQMPSIQKTNETDTSMRLNALASKYLNDQPVKQNGPNPKQHTQLSSPASNNTNFSFATMRYLERHHLVPGQLVKAIGKKTTGSRTKIKKTSNDTQRQEGRKNSHSKKRKSHSRKEERYTNGRHYNGDDQLNKILDITAIKNQPKLLPKRN